MDKDRIQLIVRNLELLVDSLKKEINSNSEVNHSTNISGYLDSLNDYDEVFVEEDY
jgi:hypothetical protein